MLASARALFAERGYAGAPREEIVERAGVTRGALYHHFDSKEALFRAVYEQVEDELTATVATRAMKAANGAVEVLRLGARAFLDAAATPEVRRIVLLDGPSVLSVEVRRELSERHGLGLIRETLRAAHAEGSLALAPPIEPLAHLLLAALHEAATVIAEAVEPATAQAMRAAVDQLITAITR